METLKEKKSEEITVAGKKHYLESQIVLGQLFVVEKLAEIRVVAAQIDVAETTFYKYVNGTTPCPAEILKKVYEVTKYAPILRVLTPAGKKMVDAGGVTPDRDTVDGELLDVTAAVGDLIRDWQAAIEDGKVTPRELDKLFSAFTRLRGEVDQAWEIVEREHSDAKMTAGNMRAVK